MFMKMPSAFSGGRPWFILEENLRGKHCLERTQFGAGSDIFLPRKGVSRPPSLRLSCPGCWGSAGAKVFWGFLTWHWASRERASVFLSFLVMQSLVRQGNKKLIFLKGNNHLQGINFYEQKTLKCYWFILIADTMSKCPSCLFVLLASMDEKWNGADPIRAG